MSQLCSGARNGCQILFKRKKALKGLRVFQIYKSTNVETYRNLEIKIMYNFNENIYVDE